MTRKISTESGESFIVIEPEEADICELCGAKDELRPYGPDGKRVCFDCGTKPENMEETERRFVNLFHGD